ncbi:MAG: ABC transporter permease [Desulfovibrio sp.]|nr:ABC transporter permease [Desulfovibrio sp.]
MIRLLNPLAAPRAIWPHRGLLWQWTRRLLAQRHAGSLLGPLWNLATPLLMLAVYTFVFGIVFQTRWQMLDPGLDTTKSYAVILFCGMAVFNIFSETIQGSCRCVTGNANLVKKVIFPLAILPLAELLAALATGLIWFALVLAAALLAGLRLSWTILLFPLALGPLLLLSGGIGWFVAATTVYLRDTPHLATMLLQALFFMTPIFYPEALVPAQLLPLLKLNPLFWILRETRQLLLFGQIPAWLEVAAIWCLCGLIFQAGFAWFMKTRKGFADVL